MSFPTPTSLAAGAGRFLRRSASLQIGLVIGCWLAGEGLVRLLGLPLPGGIVGMVLVLALLASRRLPEESVQRGARRLLGDMLLFFIPAALAVLDHRELLGLTGLKILFVVLASTASVMVVTALTVDLCQRGRNGDAGHERAR